MNALDRRSLRGNEITQVTMPGSESILAEGAFLSFMCLRPVLYSKDDWGARDGEEIVELQQASIREVTWTDLASVGLSRLHPQTWRTAPP